jgi:hypothetical protein
VIFSGSRKSGHFDLEAIEMATRAATHQLGAKMLEKLLSAPLEFEPAVPCDCGQQARFHEMRPKQLLTVLGPISIERPYYLCPHCHRGQSPRDWELDVKGTEYSPGVRRMMAVVGSETSFEHGREELELLAGLKATTKAVERQAEAIGDDIAQKEQAQSKQAKQLELPEVIGPAVPVLYIEMDGTQVPMVRCEFRRSRRPSRRNNPLARARSSWAAYLRKPPRMSKAGQYATKARRLIPERLKRLRSSATASTPRPGSAAGAEPTKR